MTLRKPLVLIDGMIHVLNDSDQLLADVENMPYAKLVDFVGDNVIYEGWATPGTDVAVAGWRIKQTTFVGEDIKSLWAESDPGFNHIWNDRLTLTYSY